METTKPKIRHSHNKYEQQNLLDAEGRLTLLRVIILFFLHSTPRICSKGACTLPGSINFDSILVRNGVRINATFWVGYFANSFGVLFYGFEGAHSQQPIPSVFFEHLCSENRVRFCWDTSRVRESWYVWFWGFNLRPGIPLTW